MLNSKLIGGILLIVGTSIGGGMLALPLATASSGILQSILFLCLCWLVMTSGALLVLEVNLYLPPGSNMISMAKKSLGIVGQIITWILYLVLLYSLLAAYISGGGDILNQLIQQLGGFFPPSLAALLFTFIFAGIVYRGIRTVDYVNRGLMIGKLGIYLLLILIIGPHINFNLLSSVSQGSIGGGIMILVASFGFASIVPSLREYFHDDIPALRKAIIIGSLIPLVCYIAWDLVIMGVIPREGNNGLIQLIHSEHATSGLTEALYHSIHNPLIAGLFEFFTSICMVTAFLSVSLGLFHFLADGFHLKRTGTQGHITLFMTFGPPLILVMFKPGIYLHALSYAGICCIILLLLLPILMAYILRHKIQNTNFRIIPGGNLSLLILLFVGLSLLGSAY